MTFKLKYLFCLVLVVGVALMWDVWYSISELTANQLLTAREKSKILPQYLQMAAGEDVFDFLGLAGRYEYGIDFDPAFYFRPEWDGAVISANVVTNFDSIYVKWHADWPAIEAKAAEENRIFYRQIINTVVAGLFAGWLVWPRFK